MLQYIKVWYQKLAEYVDRPRSHVTLGSLFFLEAIFFLPVDPLLLLYCFGRPKKSFLFALSATIGSVLGGIGGYFLGYWLFSWMGRAIIHNAFLNALVSSQTIEYLMNQYHQHANWAVLAAGFTPIPYKAATLSAGFCSIPLLPFVICSAISRGARFLLYAITIYFGGEQIKKHIAHYVTLAVIVISLIVIGVYLFTIR